MENPRSEAFHERRQQIESYQDLDKKKSELQELAAEDDSTRPLDDNRWLYSSLAELYRDFNEPDRAIEAFEKAFRFEPRDPEVLLPYVELLVDRDYTAKAAEVLKHILIHVKNDLSQDQLSWIHQKRALHFEQQEKFERAKYAYEKAVQHAEDSSEALQGLLRIARKIGDDTEVIDIRKRIIDQHDSPEKKANLYLELGGDWQTQLNDLPRALQAYKKAHLDAPEATEPLERIVDVAQKLQRWEEATEAALERSRLANEDAEKADWLIQSAYLYKRKQWRPETALYLFRQALDLDPTRLDAFEALSAIKRDSQDFSELEALCRELIEKNQKVENPDEDMLATLYDTLAEIQQTELDQLGAALEAVEKAARYAPRSSSIRQNAVAIAEELDNLESTIQHLRNLVQLSSNKASHLGKLTGYLLDAEKDHEAAYAYHAYRSLGGEPEPSLDEMASAFMPSQIYLPTEPLASDFVDAYIRPAGYNKEFDVISEKILDALLDSMASSPEDFGLTENDKIDTSQDLLFTDLARRLSSVIGLDQTPPLWSTSKHNGISNLGLQPRALVVGKNWLNHSKEGEIAFSLGRAFFLIQKPYYLLEIYSAAELKNLFRAVIDISRDSLDPSDYPESLSETLEILDSSLDAQEREYLVERFDDRIVDTIDNSLRDWLADVETTANRVGLLMSNNLEAMENSLQREHIKLTDRSIDETLASLADYLISRQYAEIRQNLSLEEYTG
jgi:tetratricopeptide (TPR) repeat protein